MLPEGIPGPSVPFPLVHPRSTGQEVLWCSFCPPLVYLISKSPGRWTTQNCFPQRQQPGVSSLCWGSCKESSGLRQDESSVRHRSFGTAPHQQPEGRLHCSASTARLSALLFTLHKAHRVHQAGRDTPRSPCPPPPQPAGTAPTGARLTWNISGDGVDVSRDG